VQYVGRGACVECHRAEADAYRGSHHDLAMQPADSSTVLGDFAGGTFTYAGITSTFTRREGAYWVRTEGPDGALRDYRIAYTFGVYPLQQYLIGFPRGRLQALSIVWDTRPKGEGGQRWYHLYPGERVDAHDVLHWTGPLQSWNFMCADCHSTDLRRGYQSATDSFATTWNEIDVSCEACHGPASAHLVWARQDSATRYRSDSTAGLMVRLPRHPQGTWAFQGSRPIAVRAKALESNTEVETCGQCHARRGTIWKERRPGASLEQSERVALLDEQLYFADGQQRDEVYEYGSFLQSRMARAGVTCSDCHEPHSGKLVADGNALCGNCHLPSHYDTAAHHFHKAGTLEAQCVSCHMVTRNYMVVDARRDHSFRIPRPDLSARLGSPNPCTGCHPTQSPEWAAASVRRWYARRDSTPPHYGEAIQAGRIQAPGAEAALIALAQDTAYPAIARATAVALMGANVGPRTLSAIQTALGDPDPRVRRSAAEAIESVEPSLRLRMGRPLLTDSIRSVRLAATGALAGVPAAQWPAEDRKAFEQATAEYREAQLANDDRPEAHANLGQFAGEQRDWATADREFRIALDRWSRFVPAWVDLAEAARHLRGEPAADSALRAGLEVNRGAADLHYALGLSLIRQGRAPESLVELERAVRLDSTNARFAYVYAVGLHDLGQPARALAVLDAMTRRHPYDREALEALQSYAAEAGRKDLVQRAAEQLDLIRRGGR
jgi:tetratricopeptide (TPR) repeat protein